MASLNEVHDENEISQTYESDDQPFDAIDAPLVDEDGSLGIDDPADNTPTNDTSNPEEGKLFLGGLSWETTEDKLKEHFGKYGDIKDVVVMREPLEGRSRGFGFVHFTAVEMADRALEDIHTIDNKSIDVKKAVPKGSTSKNGVKVTKIFVGGVPPGVTEADVSDCFSKFGAVSSINIMVDKETSRPRGFAFVEFEDPASVKAAMAEQEVKLGEKLVDIKPAIPRVRYQAPMPRSGYQQQYPRQSPAYRGRPNFNQNRYQGGAPNSYGGYPKQPHGSKYGMATGARPFAQNGYGYGGYDYPQQSDMQSRYQQPRPTSGYGASGAAAQGYGNYGRYFPQSGAPGQASNGYGAKPRYPSRPPQARPTYGFHPYQR